VGDATGGVKFRLRLGLESLKSLRRGIQMMFVLEKRKAATSGQMLVDERLVEELKSS
jgi:hypothetical protein